MSLNSIALLDRRRSGVLLHLSALAAPLGHGGRAFVDWLAAGGFSVWQILPLGPTGPDGSPYWVRSDAAGNPAFIDATDPPPPQGPEYDAFVAEAEDWLDDYACFEALSRLNADAPWWSWPAPQRDREPAEMRRLHRDLAPRLRALKATQFAFARQWARLRSYARSRGVYLFGDVPFYVAPNSCETWAQRAQFQLDATGRPSAVGGVPPDYFSETGQMWGNPLYDWQVMRRDGFAFWRARLAHQLARVDLLRLDHFRALAAHWAIPADAADARAGAWVRTPGRALLSRLRDEYGRLPLIAEDLGVITADVEDLRRGFALPGMRVLQFAFDGRGDNSHLPHMHEPAGVVYTGTHDNDTALGWYTSLDAETLRRVDFLLRLEPGAMPHALVQAALGSVARLAIIPAQDILALGSEARFNTPGTSAGNWGWRLPEAALTSELARHFARLNRVYGRA